MDLEQLWCSCTAMAIPLAAKPTWGCSRSQGPNTISGFLHRQSAIAKQAVITAINLLGQAVIKAAANGALFSLHKRDAMLDYIMALMASQDSNFSHTELQYTQELALNACTTLVSVEPKLTAATRDCVLQVSLGFITLSASIPITHPIFCNLTMLLSTILRTSSCEDEKSRAGLLHYLLKHLDPYVSSSVEHQRQRACCTVLALLKQFHALPAICSSPLGCTVNSLQLRASGEEGQSSNAAPIVLPPREALKLGERTIAYLPRCADPSPNVRMLSIQVLYMFFSISILLPNPIGSESSANQQASYAALSTLQELTQVTEWEAAGEEIDFMPTIVNSIRVLLTTTELVAMLRGCRAAICDKVVSSRGGPIAAVTELIRKRGSELGDADVSRITHALFTAAASMSDRCQEILAAMCCLAEHTQANMVFQEVLSATEMQVVRNDVSKLKNWPIQEAFLAISHNEVLSIPFLEHVVGILNQVPADNDDKAHECDSSETSTPPSTMSQLPQAATIALGAFLRNGSDVTTRAVEQCYPAVLCALLLQIGNHHTTLRSDVKPLSDIISTFQSFCTCVCDEEMGKVLLTDGQQRLRGDRWTEAVEDISSCSAKLKPEKVNDICALLWPALNRRHEFQRAAVAAALSQLVHYIRGADILLESLVNVLKVHTDDESATVRCLSVKGLTQVPEHGLVQHAALVLNILVARMEDVDEDVTLAAVQGLATVLEVVPEEVVAPIFLNLCVRLGSLQASETQLKENMRAASFTAFGSLSRFATGVQYEAFMEQIHTTLLRLALHVNDEAPSVRLACKDSLRRISPLLHAQDIRALANLQTFDFGRRQEYDEFVKEFVKHLVLQFRERAETYVTLAIQAFESPWPLIQANAAYFMGCLLSEIEDTKSVKNYLPQVTEALVRMTVQAPSSIVRAKSTLALSMFLSEIQVASNSDCCLQVLSVDASKETSTRSE
ncbi:unnamed protein product [Sphagnum compactum]